MNQSNPNGLSGKEMAQIFVISTVLGLVFAIWLSRRPDPIYQPGRNE